MQCGASGLNGVHVLKLVPFPPSIQFHRPELANATVRQLFMEELIAKEALQWTLGDVLLFLCVAGVCFIFLNNKSLTFSCYF